MPAQAHAAPDQVAATGRSLLDLQPDPIARQGDGLPDPGQDEPSDPLGMGAIEIPIGYALEGMVPGAVEGRLLGQRVAGGGQGLACLTGQAGGAGKASFFSPELPMGERPAETPALQPLAQQFLAQDRVDSLRQRLHRQEQRRETVEGERPLAVPDPQSGQPCPSRPQRVTAAARRQGASESAAPGRCRRSGGRPRIAAKAMQLPSRAIRPEITSSPRRPSRSSSAVRLSGTSQPIRGADSGREGGHGLALGAGRWGSRKLRGRSIVSEKPRRPRSRWWKSTRSSGSSSQVPPRWVR